MGAFNLGERENKIKDVERHGMAHSKEQAGLRDHTQHADYTSPQRIFTPHTPQQAGLARGHDLSGHSLTCAPQTLGGPHLIERGTEGWHALTYSNHYRNGLMA